MTGALVGLAAWLALPVMGEMGDAQRPAPPRTGGAATWGEVSPEREKKAKALVEQGNQALYDSNLRGAAEYYRQAVLSWDHPAIHYNLAMALRELGSLIECHKELELAVQHGPPPLGAEKYERAKSVKAAVEGELARIELACTEPGAQVTVDDQVDLFVCPKSHSEWVRPGQHYVRMTKAGFSNPTEHKPMLVKGQTAKIDLEMYPDDRWVESRTPVPGWVPWIGIVGGLLGGGAGGYMHVQAWDQFRQFDASITSCAPPSPDGFSPCPVERVEELKHFQIDGRRMQNTAYGLYAGGLTVFAAGFVALFFNAPRSYSVNPVTGAKITVAPSLGPRSGGAVLTIDF